MNKIDVIILAGGLGTRLRSVVSDMPKVLAPVNGSPFLDFLLSSIVKSNIVGRVVIAAGYMSEKILETYQNCSRFGVEVSVSVEKELLGTGGAIKFALERTTTHDVMVLNGDSYTDVDYGAFYKKHKQNNAKLTMVLKCVENSNRYGSVTLAGDKIVSFNEKCDLNSAGLINAGIYLLDRQLFDQVEHNKIISMEKDLLPEMIKTDAYGYITEGRFIDIGLPETYEKVDDYLQERIK